MTTTALSDSNIPLNKVGRFSLLSQLKNQVCAIMLIAICGLLGFAGTIYSPFQYDDAHAIVRNPYIKELSKFQETVGIENLINRSILLLTFAINRDVGGLDVFGYHLVNTLIHIYVGILLFFVTKELSVLMPYTETRLPIAVAVFYMLHPLTVESVAYLSSRSALLVALFYLLSFYCFAKYINLRNSHNSAQTRNYISLPILAIAFFMLGTGTKETIITLPIMAVIYLWLRPSQTLFKKDLGKYLLIFLPVLAAYVAYRIWMGRLFKAQESFELMDQYLYFLTQIKVIVFYYLMKWFLPINLNFEPHIRLVTDWADLQCVAALGVMFLMAWFIKQPLAKFALFWALVTVLPESSFIPLKQLASEHRTYLPGMGISLLMGMGCLQLTRGFSSARLAMLSFIILMALLTLHRGLDYRSEINLWEDTARKSPEKILVHNNLASAYIDKKRYEDAERELRLILKLDPTYGNAYSNLGAIYAGQQQWEKAKREFDQALLYNSENPANFYNAGLMRINLKAPAESIVYLERAIEMKPEVADYHFTLGEAYRLLKRFDEALKEYRITLTYQPGHVQALNNMAVVFWELRLYVLAEAELKKAVAVEPHNVESLNNLAGIYMALREFGRAIPYLEEVLAQQPGDENAKRLLDIARVLKDEKKS